MTERKAKADRSGLIATASSALPAPQLTQQVHVS
jgi:hypothetical protein